MLKNKISKNKWKNFKYFSTHNNFTGIKIVDSPTKGIQYYKVFKIQSNTS